MTSEDFLTSQVDIFNIKKEVVGSRHKKDYCFVCVWGYFLMCGFKWFRLASGFVAKDVSELLVSCLHRPSVEIPDVCHQPSQKGYCSLKWLFGACVPFESFSPSIKDACWYN